MFDSLLGESIIDVQTALEFTGLGEAFMPTRINAVVTGLGTIVAGIVAAGFAFLLIRKALVWARRGF